MLSGKRILVTGGNGFLGRAVVAEIQRHSPAWVFVPHSGGYDLRTQAGAEQLICGAGHEIVIHLAAVVGGIGANRENPGRYFYENAMMGLNVIEECRQAGVEKVVLIGSICSYPSETPVPFKESDIWNGYPEETNAPYGMAKKLLMVQAQAYRQQYGMNAITLLPVNLYGPGDTFSEDSSHVIPALIRKVYEAQESGRNHIDVWGSGDASREFLFVRDAAKAIVMATDQYDKPDPVNLGTGREITICELAETICSLSGFFGDIRFDKTKPDGQMRRCLDVSRAKAEFGFTAETSLECGLLETIAWYRQQRNKAKAA